MIKLMVILLVAALIGGCARPSQQLGSEYFTVSLSVRVDTLADNLHLLSQEKHELVPEDAVIFYAPYAKAYYGESVFDLLSREMRSAGIHMVSRRTPFVDSAYVTAIGNIFEFDAGELSGWMYTVNGQFPGVGASQHLLNPGDTVKWVYTLDLGRDIGYAY